MSYYVIKMFNPINTERIHVFIFEEMFVGFAVLCAESVQSSHPSCEINSGIVLVYKKILSEVHKAGSRAVNLNKHLKRFRLT